MTELLLFNVEHTKTKKPEGTFHNDGSASFYMFVAYFLKVLASLDRAEIYTARITGVFTLELLFLVELFSGMKMSSEFS